MRNHSMCNNTLYALRGRDGTLLWQHREPMSSQGVIFFHPPLVVNGVVFILEYNQDVDYYPWTRLCLTYCVPLKSITALRVADGSTYWRYADEQIALTTLGTGSYTTPEY